MHLGALGILLTTPSWVEVISTVILGVVLHYSVFKRISLDIIRFLKIIFFGNIVLLAFLVSKLQNFDYYHLHRFTPWDGLLLVFGRMSLLNTVFLVTLSLSIMAYRLSPWHPLASYPGPILAKISKWWMAYWIATGHRHILHQKLHEKYGPWVRLGPNELSFNDPSAIHPIYSSMFRAPFYAGAPGEETLITTVDKEKYLRRLAGWNRAFTPDSIKRFRPTAQARTAQLASVLTDLSRKEESVDLSLWLSLWAADVMGDMSFSGGFESMAAGKDTDGWMEILGVGVFVVGILGQVPWMRDLVGALPQPVPIVTFQKFAAKKVRDTRRTQSGVPSDILSIIGLIFKQNCPAGEYQPTEKETEADAGFILVAGADTVTQGAIATFRYVVADPTVISHLRKELDEAFDDMPIEDMDSNILGKLPFLDACIQESLRLRPPVSAGPPRYSGNQATVVQGHYIPAHTTVACPIYAMHRHPANFSDPNKFFPQRWLNSTGLVHNTDAFIPFSAGMGVCIGKAVALHNMKFLLATMIRSFDISFADGFSTDTFDTSYKEHNLWKHDPLLVQIRSLTCLSDSSHRLSHVDE